LLNAEPVSSAVATRFGSSQRRHYEKLKRFPGRLIVLGDALCSVNPLSGHSVGLSALQAVALDRCMRRFGSDVDRVARQMRKDAAREINAAWNFAAYEDFRYTESAGNRPPCTRLFNGYLSRLRGLSAYDGDAARALLEVWQMQRHPLSLLRPALVWKVLSAALRPRRAPQAVAPGEESRAGT
jgi:2-polyprenyl-6-methoxyphenol hydroxylase-like FAD-dependent oxidoreductase